MNNFRVPWAAFTNAAKRSARRISVMIGNFHDCRYKFEYIRFLSSTAGLSDCMQSMQFGYHKNVNKQARYLFVLIYFSL